MASIELGRTANGKLIVVWNSGTKHLAYEVWVDDMDRVFYPSEKKAFTYARGRAKRLGYGKVRRSVFAQTTFGKKDQ